MFVFYIVINPDYWSKKAPEHLIASFAILFCNALLQARKERSVPRDDHTAAAIPGPSGALTDAIDGNTSSSVDCSYHSTRLSKLALMDGFDTSRMARLLRQETLSDNEPRSMSILHAARIDGLRDIVSQYVAQEQISLFEPCPGLVEDGGLFARDILSQELGRVRSQIVG